MTQQNAMPTIEEIHLLDDLRTFIHKTLCEKENLLEDQFSMAELVLRRGGKECGLQFLLRGPRSVRLGAIWASEYNSVYFYDANGHRYLKLPLVNRLTDVNMPASEKAAA